MIRMESNLVKNKIIELINDQNETCFSRLRREDKLTLLSLLFNDKDFDPYDHLYDVDGIGINKLLSEFINNEIEDQLFKSIIIRCLTKHYVEEFDEIFQKQIELNELFNDDASIYMEDVEELEFLNMGI